MRTHEVLFCLTKTSDSSLALSTALELRTCPVGPMQLGTSASCDSQQYCGFSPSISAVGKLLPSGQIQPPAWFYRVCELIKMMFIFLNGWETFKSNIFWHVKIQRKSNSSVRKVLLEYRQPCLSVSVLSVFAFVLGLNSCSRDPNSLQSRKY